MKEYSHEITSTDNTFIISIAGINVEVAALSPRCRLLCRDYITENKPDFKVSITDSDIRYEAEELQSFRKIFNKNINIVNKSSNTKGFVNLNNDYYLEVSAIYRKIVEKALLYDLFLMHGAVIALENDAFMFSAPSGTGKTTHIRKWLQNIEGAYVVNGDKPLIKITGSKAIACGTPWSGNEHLNTNTMVPLKAIVLMFRSDANYIQEISFAQAYPLLLQQTYIPASRKKAIKTLKLIAQLQGKVHFFQFYFNNFKDDCFSVAHRTLIKEVSDCKFH